MVIYLLRCPQSGKGYVGQTIRPLRYRWRKHCCDANAGSLLPIHCAIRKYGEKVFEISVLATATTLEELNTLEEFYIKGQNTISPNGYNLDSGGKNHVAHPETRAKMSALRKGYVPSQETLAKMSASLRGHPTSLETRAKLSAAWKNRKPSGPLSPEHRAKLSAIKMGHTTSSETRAKISASKIGNKAFLGHRHSPETREKQRLSALNRYHKKDGVSTNGPI